MIANFSEELFDLTVFSLHSISLFLYIKPEIDYISILYDIYLSLEPYAARTSGVFNASIFMQIIILKDLRPYKTFLHIGVDFSCGFEGPGTFYYGPCLNLLIPSGKEGDKIQDLI